MATVTNPDAEHQRQRFYGGLVGCIDGFEGEDGAPRRLIGESVARVDEERVEREDAGISPHNAGGVPVVERGMPGLGSVSAPSPRQSTMARRATLQGSPALLPRASHRTRSTCRSGGAGGRVCDPTTTVCRPARLRSHTASQLFCLTGYRLVMSIVVSSGILCPV